MRRIFLFLVLILSVYLSNAQRFKGGVVGGLLSSQVDGDMAAGYNKAGLHAGVFIRYNLYQNLAMQTEMRFIMKGALESRPLDGFFYQSKLNYVEMPFTALIKKGRFHFEAGPALGVLLSAKEEDESGELNLGLYPPFKKLEISAIGGFFYDVNDRFLINFRIQYSLTPVRVRLSDNVSVIYRYQKYSFNNLMSFGMYYFPK
jgi:hypothetical protein